MLARWRLLIVLLCWFQWSAAAATAQTAGQAASNAEPGSQRTILVAGDSLSAEYGLKRGSGWVSLIAQKLAGEHYRYRIQNSSISGDTTSGGVSRMPELLKRYAPDIVIIELGSNDALRGLSLAQTKANLSSMIQMAQEANARVLLVGMRIPPNYGASYAEQFRRIFTALGRATRSAWFRSCLKASPPGDNGSRQTASIPTKARSRYWQKTSGRGSPRC